MANSSRSNNMLYVKANAYPQSKSVSSQSSLWRLSVLRQHCLVLAQMLLPVLVQDRESAANRLMALNVAVAASNPFLSPSSRLSPFH